jgi:hypothetical protein
VSTPGGILTDSFFRAAHPALAETGIAGIAHDAAGAAALRAGLLQREKALRHAHLAYAAAGVAGSRAALGAPEPWQTSHSLSLASVDFDRMAEHRLGQIELDLDSADPRRDRPASGRRAGATEDVAEDIAEDIAEGLGAAEAPPPCEALRLASRPAWPY